MFPPYSASDYGNENGPGVSLVEIEPGVAVVMGDRPLESMGLPAEFDCEVTPFQLMPPGDIQNLADKISLATGGLNLAAQGAQGMVSARGLVRLAPETMKAMKSGLQPLTSGGKNLGGFGGQGRKNRSPDPLGTSHRSRGHQCSCCVGARRGSTGVAGTVGVCFKKA